MKSFHSQFFYFGCSAVVPQQYTVGWVGFLLTYFCRTWWRQVLHFDSESFQFGWVFEVLSNNIGYIIIFNSIIRVGLLLFFEQLHCRHSFVWRFIFFCIGPFLLLRCVDATRRKEETIACVQHVTSYVWTRFRALFLKHKLNSFVRFKEFIHFSMC